jgi:CO/xanthine dehydrogenase FAD-binding subunit
VFSPPAVETNILPSGVELTADGRARILSGSTEIGQGTRTIFCQIVADELGLDIDRVDVEVPDTSRVPDSGPTVASRTTMVVGTRRAQAISKTVLAAKAGVKEERIASMSISVGSVAPTVIRARQIEQLLKGAALNPSLIEQARHMIAEETRPITDLRSTEHYRRTVTGQRARQIPETAKHLEQPTRSFFFVEIHSPIVVKAQREAICLPLSRSCQILQ